MIHDPSEDEEPVRESVHIPQENGIHGRREGDHSALDAAADSARDVKRCARRDAAGQDEAAQWRHFRVRSIDQCLEPLDVGV